jgi:type VI protein secretion system component Hcp
MAPAHFLKIDGIEGESREPGHVGELELESVSWAEQAAPHARSTDVTFTARLSRASPELFLACASGRRISGAVLTFEDPAAGAGEPRRWRFTDLTVSAYAAAGAEAGPLDVVTLSAAHVEALPALPRPTAALRLELIRPDDLLNLEITTANLRLDRGDPAEPALVVDEPGTPARLVVGFPPQTIHETAYFESSEVEPDETTETPITPKVDPDQGKTVDDPLPPPGVFLTSPARPRDGVARLGQPSRLVFAVENGARIPFTIDGLLDWSALAPVVSPIAAIGRDPNQRQIANAPAIRPPEPGETALELPYRLVISPNAHVSWLHRTRPFTSRGRTELWHTQLVPEEDDAAPLRAIWSPDYNPVLPPAPTKPDPHLGLTAMWPNDRHQIVILTSAFHGYEYEVELKLPGGFVRGTGATGHVIPLRLTFPYVPEPFDAELLMLSPLGAWLRSRGHWTPPYEVTPDPRLRVDVAGLFALPQRAALALGLATPAGALAQLVHEPEHLDLSEWVHVATQGRDHYVRIVYEGQLKPFKNKAALIKVTERKFKELNGLVVAYLMQRMFIVVREPVVEFAPQDRAMPFTKVRLTTLVTPDIAEPVVIDGTNRSFWVEVKTGATSKARFAFHGVGTDRAGNTVDFTIPMMFVSLSETGAKLGNALDAYNLSTSAAELTGRELRTPGQQLAFTELDADPAKRNSRLVTDALNFVLDEGGDPLLLKADVHIPQVQELLGTDAATTIRLHQGYVSGDLQGAAEVFAEIVDVAAPLADPRDVGALTTATLGATFSSDKAGGFATPNLGVSTLTRALGPLAGDVEDAIGGTFDPASFFPTGLAKLFGSFDLGELLHGSSLDQNAPKLRTTTQDIPNGKLVKTTIDWEPGVENVDLVIVEFSKDHGGTSELKVHGVITKSVKLDGAAEPPTYELTGSLNAFRVGVLKAVYVNFVEFGFESKSGQKPDVTVSLDTTKPVEFAGDLEFVEELRKAIPPGLFGDGPSLDVTGTGIRAGFAVGLPPIAVGVFALKDVNLGAALTLPFTDGKPVFDFNVSQREHPFLLAVSIFGGGGFFHLQVDTAGIKLLEAALEFGATASLDIGVASGSVHMMAGIYFKLERKDPSNDLAPTLSGYLRLGGSLSVLGLITVSVEFNLSFTYVSSTHKAYGRATLTVEVEVAFFSTSVELTVERSFGGQGGDPKFRDTFTTPQVWSEYAKAFA